MNRDSKKKNIYNNLFLFKFPLLEGFMDFLNKKLNLFNFFYFDYLLFY